MKSIKFIELNADLLEKIHQFFPSKKYKTQSHLFYEGQVPISGYLILDGSIKISKKKKLKKILSAGSVIGVDELIQKKPVDVSAEVYPNTELCFIDKTTLLEIIKKETLDLSKTLKKVFEIKHD
jgi:CRP-like cAMP-binding protein